MVASDNGPGNLSDRDREFIRSDPAFLLGISNPTASQIASIQQSQSQLARILDKNSLVGVLRLKHDVGKKDSFVGLLATAIALYQSLSRRSDGRFPHQSADDL